MFLSSLRDLKIQDWKKMIRHVLLVCLMIHCTIADPKVAVPLPPIPKHTWLTLHGEEPFVVANGGFSGLYPPQTELAYSQSIIFGKGGTVLLCDLHMSRDGQGFCLSQLNLQNTTNAADAFPNRKKTYIVNGKELQGWFALDFTSDEMFSKLIVTQSIFSRTDLFDFLSPYPTDLYLEENRNALLWINAEHATFYNQHKLSLVDHLKQLLEIKDISYISSPEIGFLKSMGPVVHGLKTKLIFKFPTDRNAVEPTTNEPYASLLTKLSMIKTFVTGIVVPREYIWPVNKARYLEPSTNLVVDAHKQGLEIFAYGFANDNFLPHNYSYDLQREYLQFVDNSKFSVDGVVTDFPTSASTAIACLAGSKNASRKVPTLIISANGANGDYPGSTDLAYQKAVDDGADIIDCSVQMTKDGVAFCLPSVDLIPTTTASGPFMSRAAKVDSIQSSMGIFSFDFTWDEILSLKPQMFSEFNGDLIRDPARKNVGKFVTLSDFLEFAKAKAVPGVLINIENAAYLASNKGLDVVDAVTTALTNTTLDKQSTQKVLIMSGESSVLDKFKDISTYQRVLHIKKQVEFVTNETALEIKKHADAVFLHKHSLYTQFRGEGFTLNFTNLIECMHWANVSVYAGTVLNEFQDIYMDYSSDPYMLIHNLIYYGADGIITQYPSTANAYTRNLCTENLESYRIPDINPGDVITSALDPKEVAEYKPPPPVPLETKDFVTPPLPPVAAISKDDHHDKGSASSNKTNTNANAPSSPSPPPEQAQTPSTATVATTNVVALFFATMLGLVTLL